MSAVVVLVAAFLGGAIPFGVLVARRRGVDLRERGSGNIGATNAARVLGVSAGLIVLVLDAGKGALAAFAAAHVCTSSWVVVAAGFAAILGHCFSPFLGGHGGKGVATALGVFVVLAPALALIALGVFLVVAGRTKIVAIGSLSGIAAAVVTAFVTDRGAPLCVLAAATLALLVYTHRRNIAGFVSGTRV
jgi:acyl phosphate:glycerol-3-phosphate acyltransferase